MRRWQTIFRTIRAIYFLGFSFSFIDFLSIFRCFDIESLVESFSRMSNDTISNENVCLPLKRSWKRDMGDQISVKSNRILSVFSVLSTSFEEKKRHEKLPFHFFMSSLTFFQRLTLLICLSSFYSCLFAVNHLSEYPSMSCCFLLPTFYTTFDLLWLTNNYEQIIDIECCLMAHACSYRNWEFIDDDLAQIWISL